MPLLRLGLGAPALLALSILVAGGAVQAAALTGFTDLVAYESSSGELPTAQGWSFFTDDPAPDDGLDETNYFLSGGLLVQGSTGGVSADPANRQWISPPSFDYDIDRDVVIVDLRVRILESTHVEPPTTNARAGFGVLFADRDGDQVFLYVSENGIFLVGASDQTSSLYLSAPMSAIRDYRIQIDADGASVYTNGSTRISLPRSAFFPTPSRTSSGSATSSPSSAAASRSSRSASVARTRPSPAFASSSG